MGTRKNIADVLRELRMSRGLTQKQLAVEIGVNKHTIVSYENGLREPNSENMARLERFFGVSGAYLRGEESLSTLSDGTEEDAFNTITGLFLLFKQEYDSTQDERKKADALEYFEASFRYLVLQMRLKNPKLYSLHMGSQLLNSFIQLTPAGAQEMVKRVNEYRILEDKLAED